MMLRPFLMMCCTFVGAILLFQLGACSSAKNTPDPLVDVPENFRVVFGQGGGFAGLWEGFTVQPDGSVLEWQGRYQEDGAKPSGQLDAEQIGLLWQCVEEHDFFTQEQDDRGNMTGHIRIFANADTHQVFWRPTPALAQLPLAPLDSLFLRMHEIIASRTLDPEPTPE